jgi:hypothetical protein
MNPTAGNRLRVAAIILIAGAILALAFTSLSFRLAQSQTKTNVQAITGSSLKESVNQLRNQQVLLYVEKQGPFSEALRRQLQDSLQKSGFFSTVEVIDKYDEQMPNASIVMITKDAADFYTPVYAAAN